MEEHAKKRTSLRGSLRKDQTPSKGKGENYTRGKRDGYPRGENAAILPKYQEKNSWEQDGTTNTNRRSKKSHLHAPSARVNYINVRSRPRGGKLSRTTRVLMASHKSEKRRDQ